MKKKVICVLCFALFLLAACTMLSGKIEEEMLTQVVLSIVEPKQAGKYNINLPQRYLYLDNEDMDSSKISLSNFSDISGFHLYQVLEGIGWDEGLRIQEVDETAYFLDVLNMSLSGFDETKGWTFVTDASRRPVIGQKVEIIENEESGTDHYLVFNTDGASGAWKMPSHMSIAAEDGRTLLLTVEKASENMLPDRARRQLGELGTMGCKIYSINAVEQFLNMLPHLALVAAIVLAGLILWIQSMSLLEKDWDTRWILAVNTLLGIALLASLWYTLNRIDLPASLLPPDNILDLKYYQQEFIPIFDALKAFSRNFFASANALGQTGQKTLNLAHRITVQIKAIALTGICLTTLWLSLPAIVGRVLESRQEKEN